jgi:hypothetical protein
MSQLTTVIPCQFPNFLALFIVFHKQQMSELREGSPLRISGETIAASTPAARCEHLHNLRILFCYEEDDAGLCHFVLANQDRPMLIVEHLMRNTKIAFAEGGVVNLRDMLHAERGPVH